MKISKDFVKILHWIQSLTSSMLVVNEYDPIRAISTYAHGSTYANLAGSLLYLRLPFF